MKVWCVLGAYDKDIFLAAGAPPDWESHWVFLSKAELELNIAWCCDGGANIAPSYAEKGNRNFWIQEVEV